MAVVLVGVSKSRTAWAYKSDGASFDFDTPRITEDALVGTDVQKI